jgi:hypothetical protein
MTDQKADEAKGPGAAGDSGANTTEEKGFEDEGGGNQAPAPPQAPASLMGKVEHAARAFREVFSGRRKSS